MNFSFTGACAWELLVLPDMEFEIKSDRELSEGLPSPSVWRPGFPNRIIHAQYERLWETDEQFDIARSSEVASILKDFFKTLDFFGIAPKQEWPELSYDAAHHLVYKFARHSQAYDIELRSNEDAQLITTSIVENVPHARFFSNHDVVRQDGQIVNYVCPGGQLTYHTFEFAIVTVRPDSIILFLTCDED